MKLKGKNGAEYTVLVCQNCGKQYTLPTCVVRGNQKKNYSRKYCSQKCKIESFRNRSAL